MRKWFGVSASWFKLFTGLLLVLFGAAILYGFWKFGTILGFFLLYPWILTKVSGLIINPHVANIVALLATVVIYFGIYHGVYRRNKTYGYACLIGLLALHSVFLFFSEKDRFYSQITGEPIKYYTVNPVNGSYQLFEKPIFDAFGQQAKAVDSKTAQEIYRQEHPDKFPNEEVPFSSIKSFFDPRTGQASVFYCQNASGYHFFLHNGFDPFTGRNLRPVTPDVVEKCNIQPPIKTTSTPPAPPPPSEKKTIYALDNERVWIWIRWLGDKATICTFRMEEGTFDGKKEVSAKLDNEGTILSRQIGDRKNNPSQPIDGFNKFSVRIGPYISELTISALVDGYNPIENTFTRDDRIKIIRFLPPQDEESAIEEFIPNMGGIILALVCLIITAIALEYESKKRKLELKKGGKKA